MADKYKTGKGLGITITPFSLSNLESVQPRKQFCMKGVRY